MDEIELMLTRTNLTLRVSLVVHSANPPCFQCIVCYENIYHVLYVVRIVVVIIMLFILIMFDTIDRIAHDRMNRRISIVNHRLLYGDFRTMSNATQKRDNKSAKTKPREK